MDTFNVICLFLTVTFSLLYIIVVFCFGLRKNQRYRHSRRYTYGPRWFLYLMIGVGFGIMVIYIPMAVSFELINTGELVFVAIAGTVIRVTHFALWNTCITAILVKYWMQYYNQRWKIYARARIWLSKINSHTSHWTSKYRGTFGNIQLIAKVLIVFGLLFTIIVWSLLIFLHFDELKKPIYIPSTISSTINMIAITLCIIGVAFALTIYYQLQQMRILKIQIACLMMMITLSIIWEFGMLSIHSMITFLIYQWVMVVCLTYGFLMIPIKCIEEQQNINHKNSFSFSGRNLQQQQSTNMHSINISSKITLEQVIANRKGLNSFLEHTASELQVGDKLDKFEHQQRVMNVLKVNNNFVICIPINGIFFNSTITAKVGELWLPSGMPLSNILMKNRNVSDQLQSLFSKYMKSDSDLEVNVSKEVNEWIEKRLNMNLKTNSIKNSNLIHAFDSAVIQVFSIIGGSYTRFMRRSDYPKLAHQIAKSSAQLQPKHTIILTNLNLIADPMVPQPLHYNYNHDNHNDQDLSARTLNENANDNNSNIQIDHSVTITTTGAPKINARAISATSSRPHETHSDNVDIIHNQWILHEIIGKGAFGIVHRATNILTQKEVAIKFSYSVKQHSQYIYHAQTAKNELHILKKLTKLSHPNVIRLQYQNYRYTYTTQKGYQFDTVLLVMEYAPHGQLFDILRYSGPFDQSIARIYFQQIISALKFFHNNGIVHRDLKTENMLLDAFFDIKICDFGLSVILENKNDLIEQVGKVGTKGYIAPEILRHETYDASCDIFSAGVILFILLTSRYPFAEATKDDQIYKILTEEDHIHNVSYSGGSGDSGIVCEKFWETVNHNRSNRIDDAAVQHLIESMIRYDPKQRSSIENIQQNEWYCRGDEKDEAVQLYEIMNKKYNETQLKKIQRMKKNSRSRSRNSNKIPQNEETHVHDTADNMDMNIDSDDRDHNDQVMDQKKTLAEFESQLSQYGHGPFRVKKANYNHNLRNVSLGPGRITTTYGATLTPINEVKQMDTDDDDEEIENSLIPKRSASKMSSLLYSIQERLSADHDGESKLSSIIKSVDHNRISPHLSSQVTSTIVPLEPLKCYRINDPLVIMVGIGDYDDTLQNLIGITKDYKNIFYTFNNQYNYSLFYQTKDNQQIYTKHRFIDLKNEHLSEKIKIKWVEDEIIDFFKKARDIIIENKHDSLIAVISSHGDTDGVIYDSNFDEVQLIEIFSIFMKNDCPHLQDKPKIFFVDACRGTMKSLNKEHVLNNDLKTEASTKKLKGPNNQHKDRDRDSPNGTQSQAGLQQSQKEKTRITPLMYGDSSKTEERRTNSHILIENQQTNSKHSTYNYNGDNNNEIAMVDLEKENKQTEPKSFLSKLEEKWLPYHNEANFQIVYANIDGYAVVEAGKKGGYLIQAIKRVFCNKEYILNKQMYLNDIVLHINQEAQKMIGKVLINQQVQQVSQMDRNVKFLKRTNVV